MVKIMQVKLRTKQTKNFDLFHEIIYNVSDNFHDSTDDTEK